MFGGIVTATTHYSFVTQHYDEAATHMLDALVLQDSEVSDAAGDVDGEGTNKCSVTSSALWNSLRSTCLHLQRADLASLCDRQDLNGRGCLFECPPYGRR